MSAPSITDRLTSTRAPWVHLWIDGGAPRRQLPAPPSAFVERTLDGRRCQTKGTLLREVARVLACPAHFGQNWDALEDCLTDLDWLPGGGYWLVITRADRLLAREPDGCATLVALLADVGRAWATQATGHPGRDAVPFHTILVVPPDRLGTRIGSSLAALIGHPSPEPDANA